MKVVVKLHTWLDGSRTLTFEDARDTSSKDGFYQVSLNDNITHKFPIQRIIEVTESPSKAV